MKLKELMSNTLPRTRRHKRHRPHHSAEENSSISTEKTTNNDVTKSCGNSPSHGDFKISYWINPKYAEVNQGIKYSPTENNPDYDISSSYYESISTQPFASSPDFPQDEHTFDSAIHYDSDGAYTLPKERSKIKTNPWLPSPKTSPTTSGVISPLFNGMPSNSDVVPTGYRMDYFPSPNRDYFSNTSRGDNTATNNTSMSESGFYSIGTPDIPQDNQTDNQLRDHQMNPAFRLPSNSKEHRGKIKRSDLNMSFDYEEDFESKLEVCSSGAIFESRDNLTDMFASRSTLNAFSDCTTVYPADTTFSAESCDFQQSCDTLESHDYFESRDTLNESCDYLDQSVSCLSDSVFDEDFLENQISSKHYFANPFDRASIPSSSQEIAFAVAQKHHITSNNAKDDLNENIDPRLKYLQYLDQSKSFESSQFQASQDELSVSHSHQTNDDKSDNFPAYDYSQYLQKSPSKVDRVRNGLFDKIQQLRKDKLLVDDLVRRSREEDKVKREARMRIQQETTRAMKQVLLGTLHDLKLKLECQTDRLQGAYEQVLAMQYQEVKNKRRAQLDLVSGFKMHDFIES